MALALLRTPAADLWLPVRPAQGPRPCSVPLEEGGRRGACALPAPSRCISMIQNSHENTFPALLLPWPSRAFQAKDVPAHTHALELQLLSL